MIFKKTKQNDDWSLQLAIHLNTHQRTEGGTHHHIETLKHIQLDTYTNRHSPLKH